MKRVLILIAALLLTTCLATDSFAFLRKDVGAIRGKLVSVDISKSEINIKDNDTGKEMKFIVKRGVDPSLRIGSEIQVIYKIGTNTALSAVIPRKFR